MRTITLFLVLFWLLGTDAANSETGVVVLEDTPGCDHFIVETGGGFTLLEWYSGVVSIWVGDTVYGDLHSYGMETIHIDGRGEMRVWIEDYMASAGKAKDYLYTECD